MLSNIMLPNIRQKTHSNRIEEKIRNNQQQSIHPDIINNSNKNWIPNSQIT